MLNFTTTSILPQSPRAFPSLASAVPGTASATCCERSHSRLYLLVQACNGPRKSLHYITWYLRVSVQSVCYFLCSVRPEAGTVADIRYGGARASSGSLSRAIHVRDTPYRQTGFVITSRKAIANIRVLALRLASFMLLRSVLNGQWTLFPGPDIGKSIY